MKHQMLHERRHFTDVRALVEWVGEEYGGCVAYSYRYKPTDKDVERVTFHRLRHDVRALAAWLAKAGCAGRHCAVVGKMSYDWAVVYLAVLSVGGVLVPLDRDWHADTLADTAKTADVEFLFCDEDCADRAEAIAGAVSLREPTVYMGARENLRNVRALVAEGELLYQGAPALYHQAPINPKTMSLLVFTSGTTGKGKGVMLSQEAVLENISAALPYLDYSDKTVSLLPPHHTYGSTVMIVGHAMIGAEVYISSGIRYITKELKEQKPGHLVLVPLYLETFYRKIRVSIKEQGKERLLGRSVAVSNALRHVGIDLRRRLFSSVRAAFGGELRTVISGGAPLNPDIVDFFESMGIAVLNGYGITECAPLIAVNRSRHVVKGSVGNVIDIDTVKIHEPNSDGEGEIWVKGPNVMLGYYKNEAATAEAITEDGYFKTGDYGRLTPDGVLTITGRKKNLIILSNGKNVYPEEIENELIAVPGVLEVGVYEGKSRRGSLHDAIVAEIFPDKDYFQKNPVDNVGAYLHTQVNEYNKTAVPYKKVAVVKIRGEEFPKNTLRKIMRFKLDMSID